MLQGNNGHFCTSLNAVYSHSLLPTHPLPTSMIIEFFLQSIDVPLHDFKYLYASFDLAFFLCMVR